ncbi:MAG: SPFH domain-containing protein [Pseudomonadota bacterium]
MFGFRFVKVEPTQYVIQYRGGKVVNEGLGLSFFYFAPTTSLISVPMASFDEGFIFQQVTGDFQQVTVQGQVSFRVQDAKKTAALLNFSLNPDGKTYRSDDPQQLTRRVIRAVEVLSAEVIKGVPLKSALLASDALAKRVTLGLGQHPEIRSLGLEVLGVAVLGIKPTPETAKALEAEAREAILKAADDAVYLRRNAAVENERSIRESELETEVAVEKKKRSVRETQLDAEAEVQRREQAIRQKRMEADIELEETRKSFVQKNAENVRALAEAEAHRVGAVMKALQNTDPRVVQALAAVGMQPGQLIAQAFGGIAERAEKIGELNVSSELLQGLLRPQASLLTSPRREKDSAAAR